MTGTGKATSDLSDYTNTKTKLYYYAGNKLIAENVDGVLNYVHENNVGSPVVKTDTSGNQIGDEISYTAFGLSDSEDASYTGHLKEEETGLIYARARYYDPSIGRFISADSVMGSIADSQSLNKYTYVQNNPEKYVDPSGNQNLNSEIVGQIKTVFLKGLDKAKAEAFAGITLSEVTDFYPFEIVLSEDITIGGDFNFGNAERAQVKIAYIDYHPGTTGNGIEGLIRAHGKLPPRFHNEYMEGIAQATEEFAERIMPDLLEVEIGNLKGVSPRFGSGLEGTYDEVFIRKYAFSRTSLGLKRTFGKLAKGFETFGFIGDAVGIGMSVQNPEAVINEINEKINRGGIEGLMYKVYYSTFGLMEGTTAQHYNQLKKMEEKKPIT